MRALFDPVGPAFVRRARDGLLRLTASEFHVAKALLRGETAGAISIALSIRLKTTERHIESIFSKCDCLDQAQFVRCAFELADDNEVNAYLLALPPRRASGAAYSGRRTMRHRPNP